MWKKTEIMDRLDAAREALCNALEGVDTEQELCPGWTASALLAHISGWDEWTIPWFRAVAAGDRAYEPPWRGVDAHNAEFVAEREGLSYGEMLQDCERSRKQLKATIGDMPAEALSTPLDYPWGERGTVADFTLILAKHDEEHAAEIEAAKVKAAGLIDRREP
jgi:hypothetical protein